MKFWSLIVLVGFVMSFSGCNKEPQEGDKNSYTWKGKLVKDCSEEPASNSTVYLEVEYGTIPDADYEVIAETETDANGNFSLTYKKVRKLNATTIRLYTQSAEAGNRFLLTSPVNRSLQRDVAIADCSMILPRITGIIKDTVYLNIGKESSFSNSQYFRVIEIPEYDPDFKVEIAAVPAVHFENGEYLFTQPFLTTRWDNSPQKRYCGYGLTIDDLKKSILSNLVDSIPNGYNQIEYLSSNYPKVDTVRIDLLD